MFWTKKEIEVVFSVSDSGIMLLPLCAFGLCVAVFCQHEILSPLEDFRGGRATSPKIWRNLLDSPNLWGMLGVEGAGLMGCDPVFPEFSSTMSCLLGLALHSCPETGEAGWAGGRRPERATQPSWSPNWLITGLSPWQRPCCRGPGQALGLSQVQRASQ